eukprot:403376172
MRQGKPTSGRTTKIKFEHLLYRKMASQFSHFKEVILYSAMLSEIGETQLSLRITSLLTQSHHLMRQGKPTSGRTTKINAMLSEIGETQAFLRITSLLTQSHHLMRQGKPTSGRTTKIKFEHLLYRKMASQFSHFKEVILYSAMLSEIGETQLSLRITSLLTQSHHLMRQGKPTSGRTTKIKFEHLLYRKMAS